MSSYHNTLYNAPTILEIMKDLGVVDFPELLGFRRCRFSRIVGNTHSKSPFILKVKQLSHHFFFGQNMQTHLLTLRYVKEGVQQTPCSTTTVLASSKLSE